MLARLGRLLTSLGTSAVLLALLSALLLLNVVLPQGWLVGAGYESLIRNSRAAFFFLEVLGFGNMPTSPVFLAVLGLFFINLLGVLVRRAVPTVKRTRLGPPAEAALLRRTAGPKALARPRAPGWSADQAEEVLRASGYRPARVGERGLWAVRHPRAALGFLLFHASFFLVAAGGLSLWYTRFVAETTVVEGQWFRGDFTQVIRSAPAGPPEGLAFQLLDVIPRLENGFTVHLGVRLGFPTPGGGLVERTGRVNDPVVTGDLTWLANEAGLAPQFWLQDPRGFTLDRVAASAVTRGGAGSEVPLAEGRWRVEVLPLEGRTFPEPEGLGDFPVHVRVRRDADPVYEGPLSPGQGVEVGGARLVLEDLRYWARFRVVRERGGGLLIVGFCIGVLGLVWRQLFYRREVGVTWGSEGLRITGRSDYFPWKFQGELATLADRLADPGGSPRAAERSEEP